jgi:magnesium and cobalt transporter
MTNESDQDKKHSKSRSWLERITNIIAREPQDREQLMNILRDAEDRDVLSSDTLSMMERILHVSEMQVREVMIPKSQMVSIEKDTTFAEILPIVIESGHSRFPVFDGKDIVGILLAKDLLKFSFNHEIAQFDINKIIRDPVLTPQSKRLDILLREFRVNRNHIAIVIDEYGHVAGLVTIEDILEQIVGEIEDEYDIDEDDIHIKKHPDGSYIVKAQTPIDEFNEYFNTQFDDEEFDTIGGILLKQFGHLPTRGEVVKIENHRFKVLQSDNRRIYLLEVKAIAKKKKEK